MPNLITIFKYEWKMQIRNLGFWIILLIALIVGGLDSFPTAANMIRLDNQLLSSSYVVTRLLRQEAVLMMFGFMFLTANRILRDHKLGVSQLYMATPLNKGNYIYGKFLANLGVALTLSAIFLIVNGAVHFTTNPGAFELTPYLIGFMVVVIPMAIFTVGTAMALSALTDIRLVYILMAGYFLLNIALVPDSRWLPFYLLAGEPLKLFNPRLGLGYRTGALMVFNWAFLIGTGLLANLVLVATGKLWRERP